jgi:hypothetical protein
MLLRPATAMHFARPYTHWAEEGPKGPGVCEGLKREAPARAGDRRAQ